MVEDSEKLILHKIVQFRDDFEQVLGYAFWCEGCGEPHAIWTDREKKPRWNFNGDLDKPTFLPSILLKYNKEEMEFVCHSYVKDGQIQYLADCTHALSGQTLDLKPW